MVADDALRHFVFDHGQDFIERLFDPGRSGDAGVFLRMTDGDDHDRFFRIGAIRQTIEKPHWVWRMGEGNETCMVKGCQQHAGRDADALRHVIILVARAVIEFSEALSEHHDQPGRDLQMRLFRPGCR